MKDLIFEIVMWILVKLRICMQIDMTTGFNPDRGFKSYTTFKKYNHGQGCVDYKTKKSKGD